MDREHERLMDRVRHTEPPPGAASRSGRTAPPAPVRRAVPVLVRATDPLSREGTLSLLRRLGAVTLVDGPETPPGTVTVLVLDVVDDTTLPGPRRQPGDDEARIVLVVADVAGDRLLDLVASGVGAIVRRRQITPERLLHAVLAVARGDADIPRDLMGPSPARVGRAGRSAPAGGAEPLADGPTPREIEVLRLLADGLDTDEVAQALACSARTVKSVLHGMTTRLGLHNRTHAVAYALRGGHLG